MSLSIIFSWYAIATKYNTFYKVISIIIYSIILEIDLKMMYTYLTLNKTIVLFRIIYAFCMYYIVTLLKIKL